MTDPRRFVHCLAGSIGGLIWFSCLAPSVSAQPSPSDTKTATVKVEGVATPGSRVRLQVDDAHRSGRHFLWFQTGGPPVELSNRTEPELKVTIPPGADELHFLLVVGDEHGLREANVSIPVASSPSDRSEPPANPSPGIPEADAGDDQVGLVGRRITLNGCGSTPSDGLHYRWIQVEGPPVDSTIEDGKFLSFIPKMAGRYRFALLVASSGQISAPDDVRVDVGLPPTSTSSALLPASAGTLPPTDAIDTLLNSTFSTLVDAPSMAGPLSETFQATALRLDLYRTPEDLFNELTRRLDSVMPKDPANRARWNSTFFEPLTRLMLARLLALGLDLRTPQGYATPMTDLQKQELRGQFQALSARLESARQTR